MIKILLYAFEVLVALYFLIEVVAPFIRRKPYFPATRSLFNPKGK